MENLNLLGSDPISDPKNITLNTGELEHPTRDEFYTNYPFFRYWNSENNNKLLQPGINIYVHIPFCIQICDYCFYMKELIKSKDQVEDYVTSLCNEIEMVSDRLALKGRKVNSIYIGGGTPSVLTEPQFRKVVDTLRKHHSMDDFEFAIEAEPGTFSANKLRWYKDCGVNRISVGVQSFDDNVLKLSSRKHTSSQAKNAIQLVQEYNSFQLNVDLLSGLAGETMESWQRTLETALDQNLDMITIYKMKTYSNTTFFKKAVHNKEMELPSESEELGFMERAIEILFNENYRMWSTFAFTRNGSQSKYAENSWRGEDMIAYGASSFGKIRNINYQNLNNISVYSQRIQEGALPIYRTFSLSFKDMVVKELLLCLRLASYKKEEFVKKFGFDYFDLIPDTIHQLQLQGYIEYRKDELRFTTKGILYGEFISKTIASSVKKVLGEDSIGFSY